MRLALALAAAVAFLPASTFAQDLPEPAVEGTGTSSQTLGLVQDAVTVTVDAAGSVDTRDGELGGMLSVEVNGVTAGVQTPGFGEVNRAPMPNQGAGTAGAPQGSLGTATAGAASAPPSGGSAPATSVSGQADDGTCASDAGVPLAPGVIAELGAGTVMRVEPGCGPMALETTHHHAITLNPMLMKFIVERGLVPEDILSVTRSVDAVVLLVRQVD